MADLVMCAIGSLIPKLAELIKEEYSLQTTVKERISSLAQELELTQAALHKVAQVPWDQLDEQVQIWARQVREASYDMEDVLDTFFVCVQCPKSSKQEKGLHKPLKKLINLCKKSRARRKISGDVKDIMSHLQEVTERCRMYKVDDIVAKPAATSTVDPCLHAMYNKVKNLVGIDKSSNELISMLHPPQRDDASNMKMKTVSIVGVGGLGKTTLAKAVYDELKGDFDYKAFVPVGQKPSLKKVLKDILMDLDWKRRHELSTVVLDERQLIDDLRRILEKKRYFIVIGDLWEKQSWEIIKLVIDGDNNYGGRILITTCKLEVAKEAEEVYKLRPLPDDSSRQLFHTRIYGHDGTCVDNELDKITVKFLKKCDGIPLAIITIGSLLVGKRRDKWSEIYDSIGFVYEDSEEGKNTMRILSFSYYDLPAHLRTYLLYLCAYPEDSVIRKGSLVWKWVAEGFVHKKEEMRLFEIGEGYFNDLINRSMIQAVEFNYDDNIISCRVHDMVLDFIRSMSHKENFFTILDNNNQGTQLENNVRRLAKHNWTKGRSDQANHIEMLKKLRSFIAPGCVIETWIPLSTFTLLRILAIENYRATDDSCVRVEHLGRLLRLRFLSLRGTKIGRFPEEIGALRLLQLQMLDLLRSDISESPWSGSLPKQLACLCITLRTGNKTSSGSLPKQRAFDGKEFSVEGMTSLEELTIHFPLGWTAVWLVKGLGCLSELRVLNIFNISWDEEDQRDHVESLGHLHKLQKLTITGRLIEWQATDLVLSHDLQLLAVRNISFSKLPSCINPSSLPSLSHLDLMLRHLDEEDLKSLGGLPELHYLSLDLVLLSPATIRKISDSDACYFPKLRCFKMRNSMFSFVANKNDKRDSFHIWNGLGISMPSVSVSNDELERARHSVSDDKNKGSTISSKGAAEAPRFMPRLQVLHLEVGVLYDIPNWVYNLGWQHLPSLREINADLYLGGFFNNILNVLLRRAAEVHPNHPTLHIK